ncbi:AtpZ/AtpI family protein [Formosa sp. PL04]|uniref:AtpZ/AtpI family protein n=1 Tax=Formosa sp. PL04 TaxID=3081755 RepID=UPI0029811F0F|nr:AtpZ/AtpI family protein [Formosa sp. PL04]MDW5289025.1 AtpZ/AtpI family protein [Formosa sp. PL04]
MKDPKKKQLNKYIRFTSIALQMGLTIYLGSVLGQWLDVEFNNDNQLYFKIVTLLAVLIAMFSVIRQVLNITNKDKND